MEDEQPARHDDVVLLDVLRIGSTEDHAGVLLLCNAWQAGRPGQLVLEVPLVKVPHLLASLQAAQGAGQELESAQSAHPSMPALLPAARATSAALATSPTGEASASVGFLLQGAWLHMALSRPDALRLHAELGRVLDAGPG